MPPLSRKLGRKFSYTFEDLFTSEEFSFNDDSDLLDHESQRLLEEDRIRKEAEEKVRFTSQHPEPDDCFGLPKEFESLYYGRDEPIWARRREGSIVWDINIIYWSAYPEKVYDEWNLENCGCCAEYEEVYPQSNFVIVATTVLEVFIEIEKMRQKNGDRTLEENNCYIAELKQVNELRTLVWG